MRITAVFLFLLLNGLCLAQQNFQQTLQKFLSDPVLSNASVGVAVIDLATGQLVLENEIQRSIAPASTMKLVTTATALSILGPEYKYKTELLIDGSISKEGILNGNVWIKGYGDPSLGSAQWDVPSDLNTIMRLFRGALQQKGIRKINGYIIGDGSYFGSQAVPDSWPWNDLGNYYATGPYGLNIHDNLYFLRFRQKPNLGATPSIAEIEPEVPDLVFTNELISKGRGSGDQAYIYGAPRTYERYIRGSIPIGSKLFSIKGSVPDPPLFAAQLLTDALKEIGVLVEKGPITYSVWKNQNQSATNLTGLIGKNSPTLSQIITRTNYKSVNLYAEALLTTLGKEKGDQGSTRAGLKVLYDYWKEKGIAMESAFLSDGSGLSPKTAISPEAMCNILYAMSDSPYYNEFLQSIPLAGKTGSIANKFKGSAAEGKLYAKSGTLEHVRTYAGYFTNAANKQFAFAFFVNYYQGSGGAMRRKMDQFLINLCSSR
ncbi:MAG: D-alanyl-D-alanine carboxypeptidase/D-alanyl-D-alanine-endopeptidase [Bacteroidota bacterium]